MAPASHWLSFSLSPMEMLKSSSSSSSSAAAATHQSQFLPYETNPSTGSPHHYFLDNFYANGWDSNNKEAPAAATTMVAETSSVLTSFMESGTRHQQAPKLEDFLGDSSSIVRYSDNSQTETQDDSSLTQLYDQGPAAAYFSCEQQDLKAITGFQAFATNSGSEVDDSASIGRAQLAGSEFIESTGNELGFSNCCGGGGGASANNGLSLGVNNNNNNNNNNHNNTEKAIVSVESDCNKKTVADTFGQRTSIYRGVTRHRWTGRYEAHLWDNSCRREAQARKGRQVYLGGYDKEEKAARAYDLAALKYWGPTATTNFPVSSYTKELEEMKYVSKQEFIASLRRKSSGFSRGASLYRGVTRHHQQGRWQARIGRVAGNKDLYLGTFATEEEAAEAYDIAAIKFRGLNAVTNFEMSRYDVEAIMKSALPVGGAAKRLKLSLEAEQKGALSHNQQPQSSSNSNSNTNANANVNFAGIQPISTMMPVSTIPCGIPFDAAAASAFCHHNVFHHLQTANNFGSASTTDSSGSSSSLASPPMTMLSQTAELYIWPHQSY